MEVPNDDDNCSSWSSETNWAIAHGSLGASITLESSDSPIDSEKATSTTKTPLILKPTSPDSGPCEIKNNQVVQVGNSAGSSFMAMLVPTLLQISKSGIGKVQNKHASDMIENQEDLKIGPRTSNLMNIKNETEQQGKSSVADQQYVSLPDLNGATAEIPKVQIHTQVLDREEKHDSIVTSDLLYGQIEGALELLVSRVSRIEDICSRFEENMLKPIINMEARLQRVEQQLEVLSKHSQSFVFPSGTRISAPLFSCNESNSSSLYNDGTDYPSCGALDLEKMVFYYGELSNPTGNMSILENATQFLPSLVVTAPEFSCGDDEENNDASEPLKESAQEKSKQSLSIDHALAPALTGFLSKNTVQSSNYTQTFAFKAPEFTTEENGCDEKITSPSIQNDQPAVPSVSSSDPNALKCIKDSVSTSGQAFSNDDALAAAFTGFLSMITVQSSNYTQAFNVKAPEFTTEKNVSDDEITFPSIQSEQPAVPSVSSSDSDGLKCIKDLVSTSGNAGSVEGVGKGMRNLNDGHFNETPEGVDGPNQFNEKVPGCSFLGAIVDCTPTRTKHDFAKADDFQITEKINGRESRKKISDVLVSEENDILKHFLGNQIENSSKDISGGESINKISDVLVSEESDILKHFLGNQTNDSSDALHKSAAGSTEYITGGSDKGILQNALKSSRASALVDFEIPILDVKFSSWGNSSTKSRLEALLTDIPEFNVQSSDSCPRK